MSLKEPGDMWVKFAASVNVTSVPTLVNLGPFIAAGKLAVLSSPS